jgi:hypothetical protein
MSGVIRVDEWIAELERLYRESRELCGPDDAMTVMELADKAGTHERAIRRKVQRAVFSKAWECVHVYRFGMDGRRCRVPAYRPVKTLQDSAK